MAGDAAGFTKSAAWAKGAALALSVPARYALVRHAHVEPFAILGLTRFGVRFRYAAFFTECISSNSIGLL